MESIGKARIRINHWIEHNKDHLQEYEAFARELEASGKNKSAQRIHEMITLITQTNECLQRALKAL